MLLLLLDQQNETAYLYVPKDAVGAIIGVKGDIIRNMSRRANASIRVSGKTIWLASSSLPHPHGSSSPTPAL